MVSNIPGKGGFGYIMNFKDTSKYGSVFKSFKKPEIYKPDARATMEICIKIAEIIDVIHVAGKCYKDINEGNIYLDVLNFSVNTNIQNQLKLQSILLQQQQRR